MNSALSSIIFADTFVLSYKTKHFVKVNTLYFCQGTLDPWRAIIVFDFAFCQDMRSLAVFVTAHMGPENLENL